MSDATDIRPDAQRLIEQLPASATWDDLAYEIYVRQAIEQGIAELDAKLGEPGFDHADDRHYNVRYLYR